MERRQRRADANSVVDDNTIMNSEKPTSAPLAMAAMFADMCCVDCQMGCCFVCPCVMRAVAYIQLSSNTYAKRQRSALGVLITMLNTCAHGAHRNTKDTLLISMQI